MTEVGAGTVGTDPNVHTVWSGHIGAQNLVVEPNEEGRRFNGRGAVVDANCGRSLRWPVQSRALMGPATF